MPTRLPVGRSLRAAAVSVVALTFAPALPSTLIAGLGSGKAHAQAPRSVTFLKRVAEVADGVRGDRPVWIVISRDYPHDSRGVVFTKADADSIAGAQGGLAAGWDVAGPISTIPRDGPLGPPIGPPGCVHIDSVMKGYCPDYSRGLDSITIRYHYADGIDSPPALDPRESDAVFFSPSAIDKFVIPYYVPILGADYAVKLRDTLHELLSRTR